jgi:hypothetical protein
MAGNSRVEVFLEKNCFCKMLDWELRLLSYTCTSGLRITSDYSFLKNPSGYAVSPSSSSNAMEISFFSFFYELDKGVGIG